MSDSNEVRPGVDIPFEDKIRTIFPVSLRQLRKLNKVIAEMNLTDDALTDETVDKMVDAAEIILDKIDPELAADRERIEDVIDVVSVNKMIAAAMGADPNA